MAETLGSLVDKLSIKSIREFYIKKMLRQKKAKFSKKDLTSRLDLLQEQKKTLMKEIDAFVVQAMEGNIPLRDEKIKLYNRPEIIGAIGRMPKLSKAIDALARQNFKLWQLEDEARREDVSLEYIGTVKKKIDVSNQHRNDYIDKIDELLAEKVKEVRSKRRNAK
ncbi:DUF4254 domain-containing protein [Candidatus Omnitrophota bacterium]